MRTHRLLLSCATALAVSACASGAGTSEYPVPPATAADDDLIVLGQRIGPIALGMSLGDLVNAVGEPRSTRAFERGRTYEWSNGISATVLNDAQRVYLIQTFDARYRLDSDAEVGIGISEFSLRAKLGAPGRIEDMGEPKGIAYDLVYSAGRAETLFQIEPDARSQKKVNGIIVRMKR